MTSPIASHVREAMSIAQRRRQRRATATAKTNTGVARCAISPRFSTNLPTWALRIAPFGRTRELLCAAPRARRN